MPFFLSQLLHFQKGCIIILSSTCHNRFEICFYKECFHRNTVVKYVIHRYVIGINKFIMHRMQIPTV
jgi:hypothetical protein